MGAPLPLGPNPGKREHGGIGCDEVSTTTGHRTIGDSVSAVAAQCDGVGVTLLSQAGERERWGSVSCITRLTQVWRSSPQQKDSAGKDPVQSIQCLSSE